MLPNSHPTSQHETPQFIGALDFGALDFGALVFGTLVIFLALFKKYHFDTLVSALETSSAQLGPRSDELVPSAETRVPK